MGVTSQNTEILDLQNGLVKFCEFKIKFAHFEICWSFCTVFVQSSSNPIEFGSTYTVS